MRFLFTCGGTAGHINPALAIASALRETLPSCEILFIGASGMMEMDLVPREGYDIKAVQITNISRERSLDGLKHNLNTIGNVFQSTAEAKRIIQSFRPDAVIGTGGYVCYPVLTAAHRLHIPTVIHESNAGPGLTTKLLARQVDRILVGFEGCSHEYHDPDKVVVTGTPVRGSFSRYTKESARTELGIAPDEKAVVSVWGSLGAAHMNRVMLDMIPLLDRSGFRLVHATGKKYYASFMEELRRTVPDYESRGVEIYEYIHDMPRVMTAADLILCRAGASTLSELAFMGKPSVLVPSPNVTNNHQEKNARVLEKAGGAKVLLEGQFTAESLLHEIRSILSDGKACEEMAKNTAGLSYSRAAENISSIIIDLAAGKC